MLRTDWFRCLPRVLMIRWGAQRCGATVVSRLAGRAPNRSALPGARIAGPRQGAVAHGAMRRWALACRWAVPAAAMVLAVGCRHDSETQASNVDPGGGLPPVEDPRPLAGPDIGTSPDEMVTLTWTAPTTWSTGDALGLSEIAGFRIYEFESTCGPRRLITDVEDPTQTQATIGPLAAGEHLVGIAAYGTNDMGERVEGPVARGIVTVEGS